jgi:hypothetical protein
MMIALTAVVGSTPENVKKQWGYFDANNGLFFQVAGSTFSVVQRTNVTGTPVDTVINQADFNGEKIDGSGPDRFTLDLTKGNIFEIEFQWLGVGIVQFIVIDDSGRKKKIHTIRNPNSKTSVYMETAVLPVRYKIENTGVVASNSNTMKAICSTVVNNGGNNAPEDIFSWGNLSTITTNSSSETHLISFQLAPSIGTLPNRATVIPRDITVSSNGGPCLFTAYINSSLVGSSWTNVNVNSCMQYASSISSFSGGKPIFMQPIVVATTGATSRTGINNSKLNEVLMVRNSANTGSDTLTITVTRLSATDVTAAAAVTWGEIK